jgi:hypothetical protein
MTSSRSEVRQAVRRIAAALRYEWDPIFHGTYDGLPDDEYEAYAPHVLSLLRGGASDCAVAERLQELERDTIGVEPRSVADLLPIAARIRAAAGS